jgi:hypothetical protein
MSGIIGSLFKFLLKLILWPVRLIFEIILRAVIFVFLLVLLFFLTGNLWIPKVVEFSVGRIIGMKTVVGKSKGSLFTGRLDLVNCKVKNPTPDFNTENFATINRIVVDVDTTTLAKNTVVIDELAVDIDCLSFVKNSEKTSNYALFAEKLRANEAGALVGIGVTGASGKSFIIKKLTLALGSVHVIDEGKKTIREYKTNYRSEFLNVNDFSKVRTRLVNDLGKFGLSVFLDSIVSTISELPGAAVDGVIKIKDVSSNVVDGAGEIFEKIGSGVKNLFEK